MTNETKKMGLTIKYQKNRNSKYSLTICWRRFCTWKKKDIIRISLNKHINIHFKSNSKRIIGARSLIWIIINIRWITRIILLCALYTTQTFSSLKLRALFQQNSMWILTGIIGTCESIDSPLLQIYGNRRRISETNSN